MMENERLGDILQRIISDNDEEVFEKLYNFSYLVVELLLREKIRPEGSWKFYENVFDIVKRIADERIINFAGKPCEVSAVNKVFGKEEIKDYVGMLIRDLGATEIPIPQLIMYLNRFNVDMRIYRALFSFFEIVHTARYIDGEIYYIDYEGEDTDVPTNLRRVHPAVLSVSWKPQDGEFICPNVSQYFYIKDKNCIACQWSCVNTYMYYYPETGQVEAVYHKALLGVSSAGNEISIEQPEEVIENKDTSLDYYWIHTKGRIGSFEIRDNQLLADVKYISSGFLETEEFWIIAENAPFPANKGTVYLDLMTGKYNVIWPHNIPISFFAEVERIFQLGHEDVIVKFTTKDCEEVITSDWDYKDFVWEKKRFEKWFE